MLLFLHIGFSIASLSLMGGAVAGKHFKYQDSKHLVRLSGLSFVGLVISGLALVLSAHTSLTGACFSGLVYLACLTSLYAVYRYNTV